MNSNMGPKTTPSLISKGGGDIRYPPPGRGGNRHPLGNRVKSECLGLFFVFFIVKPKRNLNF